MKKVFVKMTVMAAGALALACGLLLPRCLPPPDGCTPLKTRCNGHVAEICDGEQRWGSYMDCDQTAAQSGGSWVCCVPPNDAGAAQATCLPTNQCPAGGAS